MKFFLALSFIVGWFSAFAQSDSYLYGFLSDLQVTAKSGTSLLISEFNREGAINEFNPQPELSYGIEISKQLSPYWETGFEFGSTILRGENRFPRFLCFWQSFFINSNIFRPGFLPKQAVKQQGFCAV